MASDVVGVPDPQNVTNGGKIAVFLAAVDVANTRVLWADGAHTDVPAGTAQTTPIEHTYTTRSPDGGFLITTEVAP
jgi:hypothetical protein